MPSHTQKKEILKYTIEHLEHIRKKAQKVTLQKILYYFSLKNIPVSYHFEPYTYGPFSKELAADIDDLSFWDEIKVKGNKIEKGSEFRVELSEELRGALKQEIDNFIELVQDNLGFANIELYTTLLYNLRALKEIGKGTDFKTVFNEFKAWKGEKFSTDEVQFAYKRINEAAIL